ncbi:MAG: hypothetical protein HC848_11105 [Limnobacter sp.]|nr:hypothetical protein [Limnobacter sp.]
MTNIQTNTLDLILAAIGIDISQLEPRAEDEGFRLELEDNFAVELLQLKSGRCRASARLCMLGKGLITQETQLVKALELYRELFSAKPLIGLPSLAITDFDNCIRLVKDLPAVANSNEADQVLKMLEDYVYIAQAFKKTFVKFEGDSP